MCRVLILGLTREFQEMIPHLQKYIWVQKIYLLPAVGEKVSCDNYETDIIEILDREQLQIEKLKIDIILFDKSGEEEISSFVKAKPVYLIGKISNRSDYFKIWEMFSVVSSNIYIERDRRKIANRTDGVSEHYEILEWEKPKTGIELSIILPTYNVEKYLPKCIESLIKWEAPYVEYLFVNDGSTDFSAQIIQTYSEIDTRVKLLSKKNGGCASARNYGVEKAQGRYIGFVDPDDFIDESMFQKLLSRAMMGNYELVYCGYQEYYEDSEKTKPAENDYFGEPYLTGTYGSDKVQLLAVNTRVAIWRCLYKKSVLYDKNIWFHEDLRMFDDLPFKIEYIFAANSAVCIPEHLYYYRIGRKEQDTECKDERLFVHFDIFRYLDAYVDQYRDRKLWDLLQVVKIQTHGYALKKIEDKWRMPYVKQAGAQLREHAGYIRNIVLILLYAGKGNFIWFTRMWRRSK